MPRQIYLLIVLFGAFSCTTVKKATCALQTNTIGFTSYYTSVMEYLSTENLDQATGEVETAREEKKCLYDDLTYNLEMGMLLHFQKDFQNSNMYFEEAQRLKGERFGQGFFQSFATDLIGNDLEKPYTGEVFEVLYRDIFQALNYLKMNDYDRARVELNQINASLIALENQYQEMAGTWNNEDSSRVMVDKPTLDFYNDALAHYLSYLLFYELGEPDRAKISHKKMLEAWDAHPTAYPHAIPEVVKKEQSPDSVYLNVLAFSGFVPPKEPKNFRATTAKNKLIITDETPNNVFFNRNSLYNPYHEKRFPSKINFPGLESGTSYDFKIPYMAIDQPYVRKVRLLINGTLKQEIELFENMAMVAYQTYQAQLAITYIRSITKAVMWEQLKPQVKKSGLLGNILPNVIDLKKLMEIADVRSWRTLPSQCHVGKIALAPGEYQIQIEYLTTYDIVVKNRLFENYKIKQGLNLLTAYSL